MFSTWEYRRSPQASPALPKRSNQTSCPEVRTFTSMLLRIARFHLFKGYLTQEAPSTHYSSGPQTFLVQGDTTYKYFFLCVASRSYILNFPSPLHIFMTSILQLHLAFFHISRPITILSLLHDNIDWAMQKDRESNHQRLPKYYIFFKDSAHILQILQFISIVVLVPALVGQRWVWLREAATEGHSGSCGGFFCWFVCLLVSVLT